jgi:hypothetical protein
MPENSETVQKSVVATEDRRCGFIPSKLSGFEMGPKEGMDRFLGHDLFSELPRVVGLHQRNTAATIAEQCPRRGPVRGPRNGLVQAQYPFVVVVVFRSFLLPLLDGQQGGAAARHEVIVGHGGEFDTSGVRLTAIFCDQRIGSGYGHADGSGVGLQTRRPIIQPSALRHNLTHQRCVGCIGG